MSPDRTRKNFKKGKAADTSNGVDRRGRPGKFTVAQVTWIKSFDKLYDAKVAPYNGQDEDDADLKEWVDLKWIEFQKKYDGELVASTYSMDDLEKAFRERYKNRYHNSLKKKANRDCDKKSLLDLIHIPDTNGYHAFTAAHKSEVSGRVNVSRNLVGSDYTQHAGLFQKDMSSKWNQLTSAEKAEWNTKAKEHDPPRVYRNQKKIIQLLNDVLIGSQGFGEKQAGDLAHLVLSTFRDKNGRLVNNVLVVEGKMPGAKPMFDVVKDFSTEFLPKWDSYTNQAIPDSISELLALELAKQNKNTSPPPLLKDLSSEEEENLTPASMRIILEKYFVSLWSYAQGDANTNIPWNDIKKAPQTYIISSFLPQTILFDEPRFFEPGQLYPIRQLILNHQLNHPLDPFILFADMFSTHNTKDSSTLTDTLNRSGGNDGPLAFDNGEGRSAAFNSVSFALPGGFEAGRATNLFSSRSSTNLNMDSAGSSLGSAMNLDPHKSIGASGVRETSASEDAVINLSHFDHETMDFDTVIQDEDMRIVNPNDAPFMAPFMPLTIPQIIPPSPGYDCTPPLAVDRFSQEQGHVQVRDGVFGVGFAENNRTMMGLASFAQKVSGTGETGSSINSFVGSHTDFQTRVEFPLGGLGNAGFAQTVPDVAGVGGVHKSTAPTMDPLEGSRGEGTHASLPPAMRDRPTVQPAMSSQPRTDERRDGAAMTQKTSASSFPSPAEVDEVGNSSNARASSAHELSSLDNLDRRTAADRARAEGTNGAKASHETRLHVEGSIVSTDKDMMIVGGTATHSTAVLSSASLSRQPDPTQTSTVDEEMAGDGMNRAATASAFPQANTDGGLERVGAATSAPSDKSTKKKSTRTRRTEAPPPPPTVDNDVEGKRKRRPTERALNSGLTIYKGKDI